MKRERTFFEKAVINLYYILLVVGVGSFVLDITKDCTFTITIAVIVGVICLCFKANEILEEERKNEEFRMLQKYIEQQKDHQE